MITLTRLGGTAFALNPDLIEKAEETPDTVVTLVNGQRVVIRESLAELVRNMREHRARVLVMAQQLENECAFDCGTEHDDTVVVPTHGTETGRTLRVVTQDC